MQKFLLSFLIVISGTPLSGQGDQKQEDTKEDRDDALETDESDEASSLKAEWVRHYLWYFLVDTGHVWKNIFTISSLKVATGAIPLYLINREANKITHKQFFNATTQTNYHQPCKFLKELAVADGIVAIPFLALNVWSWFTKHEIEFRRVQVFNAGLVSTWITKMIIKRLHHKDCYRPWNQNFCPDTNALTDPNGFPSGHSAMVSYLAAYWALEKGWKWGLPLGAYAVYTMAINVAVNHHYLSQVFAGATIGVLFGVAAHKTFQQVLVNENITFDFGADSKGKPAFTLAYDF